MSSYETVENGYLPDRLSKLCPSSLGDFKLTANATKDRSATKSTTCQLTFHLTVVQHGLSPLVSQATDLVTFVFKTGIVC